MGAAAPETTFHNYGTFKKTAFGDSTVFLEFSNHLGGLVSVEHGAATLRFASGGIHEGRFSVPATSTILFERWTILAVERAINTIKPTCALLGDGTYELQRGSQFHVQPGANLSINRHVIDDQLQQGKGPPVTGIKVDGQVTVKSMTIQGGRIWGASQLTIPSTGTLQITSAFDTLLQEATLRANGTVNWDDGDFMMTKKAKFIVDGGKCFVASTGTLSSDVKGPAPGQTPEIILRRNGLITNVPPAPKPTIQVPIRNRGGRESWKPVPKVMLSPFDEQTDGQIVMDHGTVSLDGTFTESGGTVEVTHATFSLTEQALVQGGTFDLDEGTVAATGGMVVGSGGTLSGAGTIDGTFSTAGTLLTTVGPSTGQCDEIHVSHFAALGGALSIDRGSYVPVSARSS